MLDSVKKGFLASLGVVALTREKLEQAVDDLVSRGELSAEQGRKVVETIVRKGEGEARGLGEKVSGEFEKLLSRGPLATKAEVEALSERVARLERPGGTAASSPEAATGGREGPTAG